MIEKSSIFAFDNVRVEPCAFKVWKDGSEVPLEPKTFSVLLFLMENRGRLVEKTELLDAVWKDTFVTENAMTREIAKLRKMLGDDPKEARYIQTVHTRGYRFIAEVTEIDGTRASEAEPPAASTAQVNSDESEAIAQPSLPTTDAGQKVTPKNHRSIALKLSALLGVLVLLAAGVWFIRNRQQSFAVISIQRSAQITNWSGLDDFPSLSPDGNTVAYCSDHNGSFEIYVKQTTPGAKEIQLTDDGGQNFQPAFSPDGQRIAYYSKLRGGIWIIPASGGEARQITEFGSHPAWSPDGKQIAFQSNPLNDLGAYARNALPPSTLWLVAAEGGEPKQLTQIGNPPGGHGAPSFSPDGRRIVFEVNDFSHASVWTISTGGDDSKQIIRGGGGIRGWYEPVYAPDGKSVLFTSLGGVFQARLNPETAELIGEPSPTAGIGGTFSGVRRVSFSADGKRMAYSALLRRESLSSVRLQTNSAKADGAPITLVQNTNDRTSFPAFSPDGKRIAFLTCSIGGRECDIWLMNADGSNQMQLTTNENSELIPSWFQIWNKLLMFQTAPGIIRSGQ